jgi:catechol 2,3-dioxygenase-like lactoylglutathione lyase family enzyme
MKPTMTHLALHVQNLDACIVFYQDFCQMQVIHERSAGSQRIVWLAEAGREHEFIFVLMSGSPGYKRNTQDYGHLGFALASREAVDDITDKARRGGCLLWEPRQEPYPVGYYCGVLDPDGNAVEFSYGQPLGPGAESVAG